MFRILLFSFLISGQVLAGLPPTTSKISGDSTDVTTFKYQFPNFTGTHTGTTVSLGVNNIAGGGTNNGSLAVTAGGLIYSDGSKLMNTGAGTSGQVLTSAGASAPTWANLAAKSTGEVFMTAKTSCPTGSLAADGSSLLRSGGTSCGGGECANLFAAISTTYGAVDGTHFTLPDMRGVFARGAGSQTISSITYTGTQGTTQGDQMQGHRHNLSAQAWGFTGSGSNNSATLPDKSSVSGVGDPTTDGTNGTPRTGSETRPANITLLYCIVY